MKYHKLFLVLVIISIPLASQKALGQATKRDIHDKYVRQVSLKKGIHSFLFPEEFNKSYALVIGLSDYSGGWSSLEATFEDAKRVRDFLIDQAQFDMVITLTNREATLANITKYMEEILPQLISDKDRFLFYFSGHGTQRDLGNRVRGYLPMLNSTKESWADMISMDDIERWNENIHEAKHALFVLDCCFSGLAGQQRKGDSEKLFIDDLVKYSHCIITAGTANQQANASLKRWNGSLFTDAFLKGIYGKADTEMIDYPKDGIVSLTELYGYIRKKIKDEASILNKVNQSPQMSDLADNEGEFFFIYDTNAVAKTSKKSIQDRRDKTTEIKGIVYQKNYYFTPFIGIGMRDSYKSGFGINAGFIAASFSIAGSFVYHLGSDDFNMFYFGAEFGYRVKANQRIVLHPYISIGSAIERDLSESSEGNNNYLYVAPGMFLNILLSEKVAIGPDARYVFIPEENENGSLALFLSCRLSF